MLKAQLMNEEKLRMLPDVPKDPVSGKKPTHTQLKVVLLLNPIGEHPRTHEDVAKILGVTLSAVTSTMVRFKKRCPTFYSRFTEVKRNLGNEQKDTHWNEILHRLKSIDEIEEGLPEYQEGFGLEGISNFLHHHMKEKF